MAPVVNGLFIVSTESRIGRILKSRVGPETLSSLTWLVYIIFAKTISCPGWHPKISIVIDYIFGLDQ